MSAERLLASFIVRVLVRSGERSISLHDLRSGESRTFGSYGAPVDGLTSMLCDRRTGRTLEVDARNGAVVRAGARHGKRIGLHRPSPRGPARWHGAMAERRPVWIYGVGTEPDPRFTLANERTLLAWIRTGLGLIGRSSVTVIAPNGKPFSSPGQLKQMLRADPSTFTRALTEKLLTYALGRGVEYEDMPMVRSMVRAAQADGYRFSALATAIVNSPAFQMNMKPEPRTELRAAR